MGSKRLDRISDYARAGYDLRVFCMACGHVRVMKPADVLDRCKTHRDRQIDVIEQRLKCASCGARKAACGPVEAGGQG